MDEKKLIEQGERLMQAIEARERRQAARDERKAFKAPLHRPQQRHFDVVTNNMRAAKVAPNIERAQDVVTHRKVITDLIYK